jgi:hypothetical protein
VGIHLLLLYQRKQHKPYSRKNIEQMPNVCKNKVTIISCEAAELDEFVKNELQFQNSEGEYYFNEDVERVLKRGKNGIMFEYTSPGAPPLEWFQEALGRYPSFWIKDHWLDESGLAGIWIGSVDDTGEQLVRSYEWMDLCLEARHFLFSEDDIFAANEMIRDSEFESDSNLDLTMDKKEESETCCFK